MPGGLTGCHKSKVARIPRRIVNDAMILNNQRHKSGSHGLRWNTDLLDRLLRRAPLVRKGHIMNRLLRPGRVLYDRNVIDLERGGDGETNRWLLLRDLKG